MKGWFLMSKLVNKIILKHLACSYVMYCKVSSIENLSFEKYLQKYNLYFKHQTNEIQDIVISALQQMKKEKKETKK